MASSLQPLGSVQTTLFKELSGILWYSELTISACFEIFRDGCCDLRPFLNSRTFDVWNRRRPFLCVIYYHGGFFFFYAVHAVGGRGTLSKYGLN